MSFSGVPGEDLRRWADAAKGQFERACHDMPSSKAKSAGEKHKDRLTWLRERANEAVQVHNDLGDAFEAGVAAAHEEGFRDGFAKGEARGRKALRPGWDRFLGGRVVGAGTMGATVAVVAMLIGGMT